MLVNVQQLAGGGGGGGRGREEVLTCRVVDFYLEIIGGSHAVVRNNIERSPAPFTQFPRMITSRSAARQSHNQDIDMISPTSLCVFPDDLHSFACVCTWNRAHLPPTCGHVRQHMVKTQSSAVTTGSLFCQLYSLLLCPILSP